MPLDWMGILSKLGCRLDSEAVSGRRCGLHSPLLQFVRFFVTDDWNLSLQPFIFHLIVLSRTICGSNLPRHLWVLLKVLNGFRFH